MEAECPRQIVMEKECRGLHPTSGLIMAYYDDDDDDDMPHFKFLLQLFDFPTNDIKLSKNMSLVPKHWRYTAFKPVNHL